MTQLNLNEVVSREPVLVIMLETRVLTFTGLLTSGFQDCWVGEG